MQTCFTTRERRGNVVPIQPVMEKDFDSWLKQQDQRTKNWMKSIAYYPKSASVGLLCDAQGNLERVFLGMSHADDFWAFGQLSATLPKGTYRIEGEWSAHQHYLASLAWGLGAYQFTPYKKAKPYEASLLLPEEIKSAELDQLITSIYLVRDLINTPTEDMGPAELAEVATRIADEFDAEIKQIIGEELLKEGYPAIHAVGRASDHAPRLIDLRWGNKKDPKLTLVGKGVCFDTGGLNIKPSQGMTLMKKDMGGAAHVLGLAHMVMAMNLPVRLRVLIPAVENAISGDAFHPGDVITTRKGITVEVTNTDAEGRLILCDALTEAASEDPDLLIDFATLTGAARLALGTDIAVLFTPQEELATGIMMQGKEALDPVWQLPLYAPYRELLKSSIAEMANVPSLSYGGAIVAAVFLKEFVPDRIPWAHFDIMAWNLCPRPGRPEGAEAHGLRAVYAFLKEKFI